MHIKSKGAIDIAYNDNSKTSLVRIKCNLESMRFSPFEENTVYSVV